MRIRIPLLALACMAACTPMAHAGGSEILTDDVTFTVPLEPASNESLANPNATARIVVDEDEDANTLTVSAHFTQYRGTPGNGTRTACLEILMISGANYGTKCSLIGTIYVGGKIETTVSHTVVHLGTTYRLSTIASLKSCTTTQAICDSHVVSGWTPAELDFVNTPEAISSDANPAFTWDAEWDLTFAECALLPTGPAATSCGASGAIWTDLPPGNYTASIAATGKGLPYLRKHSSLIAYSWTVRPNEGTWYSGSGAPATSFGAQGDFYLDTSTQQYYGPRTAGGWGNALDLTGAAGADGRTILSGTATPGPNLGVNGDFYLDVTDWIIFGPKTAGTWGDGTTLRPPTDSLVQASIGTQKGSLIGFADNGQPQEIPAAPGPGYVLASNSGSAAGVSWQRVFGSQVAGGYQSRTTDASATSPSVGTALTITIVGDGQTPMLLTAAPGHGVYNTTASNTYWNHQLWDVVGHNLGEGRVRLNSAGVADAIPPLQSVIPPFSGTKTIAYRFYTLEGGVAVMQQSGLKATLRATWAPGYIY